VPRRFFDIHDGRSPREESGTACADLEAACREAMIARPDLARWEIPSDGNRQTDTVIVRDEARVPVYTATLTFTGLRSGEGAR